MRYLRHYTNQLCGSEFRIIFFQNIRNYPLSNNRWEVMLIINYFIGMIVGSALVYDLFYRKIPNYLILTGYAGLGPYMYIRFGIDGIIQSAAAVCVVGVTLIFIYILGGLGAGDVKLICLICGFLGLKQVVIYTILVLYLGAFIGLIKMCMRLANRNGRTAFGVTKIRFGIPITVGYFILIFSKGGII